MLGYDEDELEHNWQTWKNLVHPDDQDSVIKTVDTYLSGQAASFRVEFRMLHKEGRIVFILARAHSVFSDDNRPIRLIGTHADISERKKA